MNGTASLPVLKIDVLTYFAYLSKSDRRTAVGLGNTVVNVIVTFLTMMYSHLVCINFTELLS